FTLFFVFSDTSPTEIYTLSLHDALPILGLSRPMRGEIRIAGVPNTDQPPEDIARDAAYVFQHPDRQLFARTVLEEVAFGPLQMRSEEHTSELQSLAYLVCRLLLEKKKQT